MLADLEEDHPNHGNAIERVIELLYMDFIDKLRKGDNTEAMKTTLRILDSEE
ncbi:hypothetical protein ACQKNS_24415 [Peribacillus sp. NPDC094092]|uniref:hypothetical protein n=1 Tax=Peribacillus sp. NPDC094092 TaxID=3390611 RepID=UPI003CFFAD82